MCEKLYRIYLPAAITSLHWSLVRPEDSSARAARLATAMASRWGGRDERLFLERFSDSKMSDFVAAVRTLVNCTVER